MPEPGFRGGESLAQTLRISVVIPTFDRRDLVCAAVSALARQRGDIGYEVIVVVDGSSDGSVAALCSVAPHFPFTVVEQPNLGAATARARGAAVARGELLLFLDDDMEANPDLLSEHDRAHREGADAVLGSIPLHPESPPNFLSAGIGRWAEQRHQRLSASPDAVEGLDILTGQLSVSRAAYDRAGGFDTTFNRGGGYGREDTDFGLRLMATGCRVVFRSSAISWQRYVVTPRRYLRQYEQAGSAAVALARKHPRVARQLFASRLPPSRLERLADRLLGHPVRWAVISLLAHGAGSVILERWFYRLADLGFFRGVRRAGGVPTPRPVRVLAYHAVRDLAGSPVIAEYGVPVAALRTQLRTLARWGFHFVSEDEVLRFLEAGDGLPRRAVLVTFDDAYEEIPAEALAACREVGAAPLVFAVSAAVGGHNAWDTPLGAPRLALADVAGLRELRLAGAAIGSHARTHRDLTEMSEVELARELAGSADELEAMDLGRPRSLAYPYGAHDGRVRSAARRCGYRVAFGAKPGLADRSSDVLALPRIEIFRRDRGLAFLWKVLVAGRGLRSVLTMARYWLADLGRAAA